VDHYADPVDSTQESGPGSLTPIFAFYAGVLGVPLVLLAVIVTVLTPVPIFIGVLLVLAAVILAAFLTYRRYERVDEILLDDLDVVDADDRDHARAFNLLEALSLRSGVGAPELYLTDDESVNALAIQQSGDAAAVITAGAAAKLDRLQLEGLLAEVIARIAGGDARAATVAVGMLMPFTTGPLSFLSGFADSLTNRVLNPERELRGDQAAVTLTRYPPGLREALSLAEDESEVGTAATARLWVVPPATAAARYDLTVRLAILNEY
jgi:Zn-dependent protease with chaperone function